MLPRFTALVGKLIAKYDIMSDSIHFTPEELDLLRLAVTEYNFYHAHESRESGQPTNEAIDLVEKPGPKPVGRPTLKLGKASV